MVQPIRPAARHRLTIHHPPCEAGPGSFAEDVKVGLTSNPKTLKPKYFYDDLGSRLFEAICSLPEYYLTRAESEILRTRVREIVRAIESPVRLVELGSGNAEKTRFLIEAILERQGELHYFPVDISPESLERSSAVLLDLFPRLRITAYAAEYFTAMRTLPKAFVEEGRNTRTMALFLGSNIGNLDPNESIVFLREARGMLKAGDGFLVGADLKKPAEVLVPAYDDALGVTAAFNLNLLARINRELRGGFDLKKFEHQAVYNVECGRMEMRLISREAQRVTIGDIDLEIDFDEGETIHTENSYKYDLDQLRAMAAATGFRLAKTWLDTAGRFSFNLFGAI